MSSTSFGGIFPVNFKDIKQLPPIGLTVSEVLLEPRILIKRNGAVFSASLVACIKKSMEFTYIPVVREGANYVIDGKKLKPLPKDCGEYFNKILNGLTPTALSFSDVVKLMRTSSDDLPVVIDDAVAELGVTRAKTLPLDAAIPGLNATLYSYQDCGIAWMSRCLNLSGGLILADEMGLGKTVRNDVLLILLFAPFCYKSSLTKK